MKSTSRTFKGAVTVTSCGGTKSVKIGAYVVGEVAKDRTDSGETLEK